MDVRTIGVFWYNEVIVINFKFMACFIAPAVAAIVTTSAGKKVSKKYHIEWLNAMLWGGVIVLVIEHIVHGEVVLYPPFLTAIKSYVDTVTMLKEIATVGTSMTVAIVVVWIIMVLVFNKVSKRKNLILTA